MQMEWMLNRLASLSAETKKLALLRKHSAEEGESRGLSRRVIRSWMHHIDAKRGNRTFSQDVKSCNSRAAR